MPARNKDTDIKKKDVRSFIKKIEMNSVPTTDNNGNKINP